MRQPAGLVFPLSLGQQDGRKHAETRSAAAITGQVHRGMAAQYRFGVWPLSGVKQGGDSIHLCPAFLS